MAGETHISKETAVDQTKYRQVLGNFPTGVVVVAVRDHSGQPHGMTIGSFVSVSLDPPLVAFFPRKESESWARMSPYASRFSVSILSAGQEETSRTIASKRASLSELKWQLSPAGSVVLSDAVAYVECELTSVNEAGDHLMVMGRVLDLDVVASDTSPLLFYRGQYVSVAVP